MVPMSILRNLRASLKRRKKSGSDEDVEKEVVKPCTRVGYGRILNPAIACFCVASASP